MKKRLSLILLLAVALMLGSGGALMASFERHYTVYYICPISPIPPSNIVGEWDVDCDGNWTGWGWEPGHGCTSSDVTFGNYCGPDTM